MYLSNKYSRWYMSIIESAKRRSVTTGYAERHHILPKSLGGSDDAENLVSLTAREHFVCHLLLPKMLSDSVGIKKMKYALYCLTHVRNSGQSMRHIATSRQCEQFKLYKSEFLKGKPAHNRGKPCSTAQKEKLRQANIGKTYTRTAEYLAKQSLAQKGKSRGKGRISNRKGISMTLEQREKIRNSMLATMAARRNGK